VRTPIASVTAMSSSRRTVWLAATTTPGRQRTPLAGMRRRAWTATTERPARSTAPAKSLEKAASVSPGGGDDDADDDADAEDAAGAMRSSCGAFRAGAMGAGTGAQHERRGSDGPDCCLREGSHPARAPASGERGRRESGVTARCAMHGGSRL
jgi:hypothetical protein